MLTYASFLHSYFIKHHCSKVHVIISIISFIYHVWWNYSSLLPSYLQASRSQHTGGSSSSSSTHDGKASSSSLSRQEVEVSQQLQSDAVERYLFLCEYMHQCGILWSPVIVAMYCYGTLLIILMAYIFTTLTSLNPGTIVNLILISFQSFLFVVFPSLSLAGANSVIAPMVHLFSNSGSRDFAMMGMLSYACFA